MEKKTILITGATEGIGLETARKLVPQGHEVLIHGRNAAKLEKVAAELGNIKTYIADLSVMAEVEALAEVITVNHKKIDVLINNAGVFIASGMSADGLDLRFAVNTIGPYLLTKLLLPLMDSTGRVVNLSSAAQSAVILDDLSGKNGELNDSSAYAQSKLAITMWSRTLGLALKGEGPVYRPPVEAGSLLLQVTVGCAHNKCNFCTMYRDTPFSVEPMEQIEKDIEEAKNLYKNVKRVFLVNGDAFVLSAKRLNPIAEKIIESFPEVEAITMYASISNIRSKTDEELKELRALRINELWVGVETGHEEALKYLNKGHTFKEARTNLKRLNEAGIDYFYGFMFGAAGKGMGLENAIANAKLINETRPIGLAPTTLSANVGTPMVADVLSGKFEIATEREVLEEMKKNIELVDLDETIYYGRHIINSIPFDCILPRDREKALEIVNSRMAGMEDPYLDSVPSRHTI